MKNPSPGTRQRGITKKGILIILAVIMVCVISAIFGFFYVLHHVYMPHLIGKYTVADDQSHITIPFYQQDRPFLMLEPVHEHKTGERDPLTSTPVVMRAIKDNIVVYEGSTNLTHQATATTGIINRKNYGGYNILYNFNMPREVAERGIDFIQVHFDESTTSRPRPLSVNLHYIH